MAYIPVPNCAQLELVYSWDTQVCQNVLHYSKASPWDLTDLQDLCASAIEKWEEVIQDLMPENLSLIEVRALDMSAQDAEYYTLTEGLPLQGLNESPSLPNNCALVLTKRTGKRGRSFRGRIYMPGLTEVFTTNSHVNPNAVPGFVTAWSSFLTLAITEDEGLLVVVSRYHDGQPRTEGEANLVLNLTSDGVIDSQRRRLPGRGS